jgi:hypothetical protein
MKDLVSEQRIAYSHPLPDLFRPTNRVPLRATQADSKRTNAKK